jgi:hypothetical protein
VGRGWATVATVAYVLTLATLVMIAIMGGFGEMLDPMPFR